LGVSCFDSRVDFKLFVATIQSIKAIISNKLYFLPQKEKVVLLVSLFNSMIDFKVFLLNITRLLRPWLQKVWILTLKKKCYQWHNIQFRGR
jgi:hypothetical protein